MFSRLTVGYSPHQRRRPEILERSVIARSPILLTPFAQDWSIEVEPLRELVESTFRTAQLKRDDIDTGAVIITGEAARRDNASKIAEIFADEAGRFVCATAGPRLEAILAAHGSGAVWRSRNQGSVVLNIDIGGGTTKITLITSGMVRDIAALNIGARLIGYDEDSRITRLENGGRRFLSDLGLKLEVGDRLEAGMLGTLAAHMARVLCNVLEDKTPHREGLFITAPMGNLPAVDEVVFSGGVSEYIYGRERSSYGDLGPLMGQEIRTQTERRGYRISDNNEGIRATVIGASQYTVQLSGETIFIPDTATLPIRNLRVFIVRVTWDPPAAENAAKAVRQALENLDPEVKGGPFALFFSSPPFLGYGVTQQFAHGIRSALLSTPRADRPRLLVFEQNIGHIIGRILAPDFALPCVDEIALSELDFIDVGQIVRGETYVPVVIKSLAFGV
jgi:ethanolamine utilization protein EutA